MGRADDRHRVGPVVPDCTLSAVSFYDIGVQFKIVHIHFQKFHKTGFC
jgi:hypothetical protein